MIPGNPLPVCIQFTLTDFCNLKCIGCPKQNETLKLNTGFLPENILQRIVSESLRLERDFSYLPVWLGEPLMHPQFSDFFDFICDSLKGFSRFKGIILHTNAVCLSKTLSERLIDGVSRTGIRLDLVFSVDAADPPTYLAIKGADHFDRVCSNIDYFLNYLSQSAPCKLRTSVQFLVFKRNSHQLDEFINHWRNIYSRYGFHCMTVYDPYDCDPSPGMHRMILRRVDSDISIQAFYEELHKKALFDSGLIEQLTEKRILSIDSQEFPGSTKTVCPAPFKFMVIDLKGNVTFCWKDKKCSLSFGNITELGLPEILSSDHYLAFAKAHLDLALDKYPVCRNCSHFDSPGLSGDEKRQIRI